VKSCADISLFCYSTATGALDPARPYGYYSSYSYQLIFLQN
jgi:hypothetical protein